MIAFRHALVTGATGFVGSHFLSRLISEFPHLSVTVGVRAASARKPPREGLQYVTLDSSNAVDLNSSHDIVFHIAAEKRDESKMWDVNVNGTRRLLDWSAAHGVKHFVYLSSVGVFGTRKDSPPITENTARNPQNRYEASKSAAEDLVRECCPNYGMTHVILRPSNVIGWTNGPTHPLLGMMRTIKRGLFTYFDNGSACFNYVAVEDVGGGLIAAMCDGAANQTFILNSPVHMKLAVDWIADELGVVRPRRRFPAALGFVAGEVATRLTGLTGKSLPFSRERFNELTNKTRYDGSAIVEATGFDYPLGIEAAMRRLARQYAKEGLL